MYSYFAEIHCTRIEPFLIVEDLIYHIYSIILSDIETYLVIMKIM